MNDENYDFAVFSQLPEQEFYLAYGRGNVVKMFQTKNKSTFPK